MADQNYGNRGPSVSREDEYDVLRRDLWLLTDRDYKRALELQDILMPLHDALFVETNPAPAKYAAWRIGMIDSPECRLPMAPLTDATKKIVDAALAHAGLLKAKAAE